MRQTRETGGGFKYGTELQCGSSLWPRARIKCGTFQFFPVLNVMACYLQRLPGGGGVSLHS